MGIEINLLKNYPKSNRDIDHRANKKTESDKILARKFGKDFSMEIAVLVTAVSTMIQGLETSYSNF